MSKLSQSSLADLLSDSHARFRFNYVAILLAVVVCVLSFVASWISGTLSVLVSVVLVVAVIRWESRRRTVYVHYEMTGPVASVFQQMINSLNGLAACDRVWALESSVRLQTLTDRKRHAGVSKLVDRSAARFGEGVPPWVEINIPVPSIAARGQTLYFLPDGILAYDRTGIGFVDYANVTVRIDTASFVEESAPSDAQIVSYTWQHPNVGGGPDRRFSSNRQLPVCLYGEVFFESPGGLLAAIQTSRYDLAAALQISLARVSAEIRITGNADAFRPHVDVNLERFQSPITVLATALKGIAARLAHAAKVADGWLKRTVGEEYDIIYQFLRIAAVALFGALLAIAAYVLVGLLRG